MPQIPGSNESQILNAGSPVPIGSSESARAPGENVARMGQALFALGDALDSAAAQSKARQKKLDLESALGDLDLKKMQYRAETERAAPGAQPYDNVKNFQTNTLDFANEIADRIDDPSVKQEFYAKAKIQLAQDSIPVYAQEVKKYDDLGNDKVNKIISQYSAMAYVDPTSVGQSLYKIQDIVNNTPDIPEYKRVEAVRKAERQVIDTSVDKFVDMGKYDEALHNVNVVYADRYTAEEKAKKSKEITDMKWERKTRGWQTDDRAEKEAKLAREKEMDAYQQDTFNLLDQAGSEREREMIIQDRGYRAFAAGLIDESRFNFTTKVSKDLLTQRDDSSIALGVFDQLNDGKISIQQAKSKVLDLASGPNAQLSREKAEQMWKFFQDAQERQKRDPLFMKQVNEGLQYIKLKGKPQDLQEKIMNGLAPNLVDSEKTMDAVSSYLASVKNGGNPMQSARNAVTKQFGTNAVVPTIKGIDYNDSDPESTIKMKIKQKIESSKLSPAQVNTLLKETKALLDYRNRKKSEQDEQRIMREQMQKAGQGG